MKKIFLILFALGVANVFAEDSYLYWMVGSSESIGKVYDTVKVIGVTASGNSYLNIYAPDGTTQDMAAGDKDGKAISASNVAAVRDDMGLGLYAGLVADSTYSSFVIELWNAGNYVAASDSISYSTAIAQNYIEGRNAMSLPAMWTATSFAIPEPSSGLLMLIGCAALGLRRRRARRS